MKSLLGTLALLTSTQVGAQSMTWSLEIEGYRNEEKFLSQINDSSLGQSVFPINDGNLRECRLSPVETLDEGETYGRKLSCEIDGSSGRVQVDTVALCFVSKNDKHLGAVQITPEQDLRYVFFLKCSMNSSPQVTDSETKNNQEENNENE